MERPTRVHRATVLFVTIALATSLIAAACGGGRSESSTSTTAKSSGGSSNSFGDLASPCGKGTASGATARGVTDTSITIGYGDDAGYSAAPGLNREQSDAMKAVIEWCNDQGGINGRQIVGKYYDAKVTEVNNVMTEACTQVFMLVGQGWVFDSGQEQIRMGCKLASVPAWSTSPAFANGELMYQPAPNPVDVATIEQAYAMAEKFPDEVKKAATFYANYPATKDPTMKMVAAYEQAGWNFLDCDQQYGIAGEANWRPFVQRLKDCGAEIVYFAGSPNPNFENVLDAAKSIDFDPIWALEPNFYDTNFAEWNTSGLADKVYVKMTATPYEAATAGSATQLYLDLVKAQGGATGLLGSQAMSAFLLWASAVQECGSTVTNDCVLEKLSQVHEWTGGGLQSAADPGANMPTNCGLVLKMNGTSYEQFYPETLGEFDCSPKYVVKVTGDAVTAANLDANRIAHPAGN